jgi:hypothetical protein
MTVRYEHWRKIINYTVRVYLNSPFVFSDALTGYCPVPYCCVTIQTGVYVMPGFM